MPEIGYLFGIINFMLEMFRVAGGLVSPVKMLRVQNKYWISYRRATSCYEL